MGLMGKVEGIGRLDFMPKKYHVSRPDARLVGVQYSAHCFHAPCGIETLSLYDTSVSYIG